MVSMQKGLTFEATVCLERFFKFEHFYLVQNFIFQKKYFSLQDHHLYNVVMKAI